MPELGFLDLFNNNISDIDPLVANSDFSGNRYAGLDGNPLDCEDPTILEAIDTLKQREITIHTDCPE